MFRRGYCEKPQDILQTLLENQVKQEKRISDSIKKNECLSERVFDTKMIVEKVLYILVDETDFIGRRVGVTLVISIALLVLITVILIILGISKIYYLCR